MFEIIALSPIVMRILDVLMIITGLAMAALLVMHCIWEGRDSEGRDDDGNDDKGGDP